MSIVYDSNRFSSIHHLFNHVGCAPTLRVPQSNKTICILFHFSITDISSSLSVFIPISFEHRKIIPHFFSDVFTKLISSRSEEHTSELQSRGLLICRLQLEKKQTNII